MEARISDNTSRWPRALALQLIDISLPVANGCVSTFGDRIRIFPVPSRRAYQSFTHERKARTPRTRLNNGPSVGICVAWFTMDM